MSLRRLHDLEARLDEAIDFERVAEDDDTDLSAIHPGMIEFTDPRPRNAQGMFADATEAGADPNTMRKAYGSRSKIDPAMLKKLRRKLPRFAVGGLA